VTRLQPLSREATNPAPAAPVSDVAWKKEADQAAAKLRRPPVAKPGPMGRAAPGGRDVLRSWQALPAIGSPQAAERMAQRLIGEAVALASDGKPVAVMTDLGASPGMLECQLRAIDAAAKQGFKSIVMGGDKASKEGIDTILAALETKIHRAGGLDAFIRSLPKDGQSETLSAAAALYAQQKGLAVEIAVSPTEDDLQALRETPPNRGKVEKETLVRSANAFAGAIKAAQVKGGVLAFPDERMYRALHGALNPGGKPKSAAVRVFHHTQTYMPLAQAADAVADGLGTAVRLTPAMTNTPHIIRQAGAGPG
jgi:hypothetical protein